MTWRSALPYEGPPIIFRGPPNILDEIHRIDHPEETQEWFEAKLIRSILAGLRGDRSPES